MSTDLFALRTRWQAVARGNADPVLRVALLASYTVDPLVPYLGLGLHDAGLPAAFTIGPFNQVVQQCLADDGFLAATRPDVLVVAQRPEEAGDPGPAGAEWVAELLAAAEAAVAAARRHGALLAYVLPAVPPARPCGVGDALDADGVAAAATAVRERLRERLAADPWVLLVDAEEAVRAVGARRAYHPALFRFAKIPYTEEVFAALGAAAAGLLSCWFGAGRRALVLDGDGLTGAAHLLPALRELRAAGVRLALRAGGAGFWSTADAPELLTVLDGWVTDDRPLPDQLAEIAAELDVPVAQLALTSTGNGGSDGPGAGAGASSTGRDGPRRVQLGADPRAWADELRAAGLTDRIPARRWTGGAPGRPAPAEAPAGLSLDDFVASLDVRVEYAPVAPDGVAAVAELVARAHDFALAPAPPAAALADRAGDLLAVRVRDRLGDYGTAGLVGVDRAGDRWTVDVFSLSCPVLGKGVEAAVLREVARRAGEAGAGEVLVRWTDTGRNGTARRFLSELDAVVPADPAVRLRAARTGSGQVGAAADRVEPTVGATGPAPAGEPAAVAR
ncbi:hypothetical protein U2F26_09910 [Micromonospora sp. 4G57]|uniref:GNAT family N-acetyltransferase n=1 Tax=Micromonospora sicca TaxID=2202420 RepID=A0ABU5J6N1_9ACTN|nr:MULTISPECIES: hypothetical protein [unclassified Micromonospora]MDZ5443042.1 hypothetical protein [Micromonospora sp. 4G57]MDZ5488246.1 hypothetical protein [Micromonospora sp. 4G53]